MNLGEVLSLMMRATNLMPLYPMIFITGAVDQSAS